MANLLSTQVWQNAFDFDFENRQYEIRELPKFRLKEEHTNGNNIDNRN